MLNFGNGNRRGVDFIGHWLPNGELYGIPASAAAATAFPRGKLLQLRLVGPFLVQMPVEPSP